MKQKKDIIIVGFALFSVFFGASNLIFPPFIGVTSGSEWLTSFLGFVLGDVGIILLSIYAIAKCGDYQSIVGRAGKNFGLSLEIIMMLCLGPILAIPRTAATTFELSITPLIPGVNSVFFSIIFFALTLILTIRPTKVMDIIGKFLTPVLLICLAFLIGKGMISPLGTLNNEIESNELFVTGLTQGYQTMDALAGLLFSSVITSSIVSKGYKGKEINSVLLNSSFIAVIGLAFVYGGLTFIGAHTVNLVDSNISNTALLVFISKKILGTSGILLIGIAIGLACLTTSIGLLTTGSTFFEKVTNGKLSYKFNAIAISLMSYIIACQGVDKIVKLSVPILNVLYPVAITLIAVTMFNKFLTNVIAVRFAVYASLIFGVLFQLFGSSLNFMPLANIGFGWVLPTIIALGIGCFIKENK